jgi:hypothetical protein
MNRTQKALTLLAIAVFVFIVFIQPMISGFDIRSPLRLVDFGLFVDYQGHPAGRFGLTLTADGVELLTLAVVYTGLLFVLQTKEKS